MDLDFSFENTPTPYPSSGVHIIVELGCSCSACYPGMLQWLLWIDAEHDKYHKLLQLVKEKYIVSLKYAHE